MVLKSRDVIFDHKSFPYTTASSIEPLADAPRIVKLPWPILDDPVVEVIPTHPVGVSIPSATTEAISEPQQTRLFRFNLNPTIN